LKVLEMCRRFGLLSALLLACSAHAENFPIVPPRLTPRAGAATPVAQAYPPQPAITQPSQAYASVGTQGSDQSAGTNYGNTAYGTSSGYLAAPSSPLGAAPVAGYGGRNTSANLPPASVVQPERAQQGTCRVELSPDRQTLELVSGIPALARDHVPLGDYRAQLVTHSSDGRWAVAYAKLRGANQYAALVIDLQGCGLRQTYELPGMGESVSFDLDSAVLRHSHGEKRIDLRAGGVQ